MSAKQDIVQLGRVTGLFGVRGWMKVFSDTHYREDILRYSPWLISKDGEEWREYKLAEGQMQGKGIIARLDGVIDRDQAAEFIDYIIAVPRSVLPTPDNGEYYWSDLIGMTVVTVDDAKLGVVSEIIETGANDVLVIQAEDKERLIPFVQPDVIKKVDLESRVITAEWDPEY